jgi:hypothetical protein
MNHTEVIDYIKQWSTDLIAIGHTDEDQRFFYNIDHIIEKKSNIKGFDLFNVVVEDRHRGRLGGHTDNLRDLPQYSFFILRQVKKSDYPDEELAYQQCKALGFKFVAYMRKDKDEEADTIARFVKDDEISYRRIGPQFGNFHGIELSFSISDNVNTEIVYNEDDYQ